MHVVITGANRGIGKTLAGRYTAQGHEVTGTARRATGFATLDVTKPDDFDALGRKLDGRPVDLLICNAGVYVDKGQSLGSGYAPALWAETLATNVTGVFLTVQALLVNLQMARDARIAIVSSRLGSQELAAGGSYAYRASKAAALNIGRNLAVDLAELGIAVGIYHPGWVKTDMGGENADIGLDESADGLVERFAALNLETTGCFQAWDGEALPF